MLKAICLLGLFLLFSLGVYANDCQKLKACAKLEQALAGANIPSKEGIFGASEVQIQIKANFVRARKLGAGGNWTGEDKDDPKNWVNAEIVDLKNPNRVIKALVRARGMSSLSEGEAEFPKLRVEIDDEEDLKGTIFKGSKNFRINTHVESNPTRVKTGGGRLVGENSPLREALGLGLARTLGLTTLANRIVRIKYVDTGTRKTFTRNALLIETDKKFKERYEVEDVSADVANDEKSGIDSLLGAVFHLYHKMIGNDDIGLRVNEAAIAGTERYRPVFNTTVFQRADKSRFPIVYDLDYSTFVSGERELVVGFYSKSDFGIKDARVNMLVHHLYDLRKRFAHQDLESAITYLESKKSRLYDVVAKANVDEDGRKNAVKMLDVFFANVRLLIDLPVIGQPGVPLYVNAEGEDSQLKVNPMTEEPGTLRIGTPVKILGEEKGRKKIVYIDFGGDNRTEEDGSATPTIGYIPADAAIVKELGADLIGEVDEREMVW